MSKLQILDAQIHQGLSGKPNEDAFAINSTCVAVIDGATGLGESQIIDVDGSDAEWFAVNAANWIEQQMQMGCDPVEVVDAFISDSKHRFFQAADGENIPRYAWPSASLAMILLNQPFPVFIGLGDCVAYIESETGVEQFSALPDFGNAEMKGAADHIKRLGGLKNTQSLLGNPKTLEELRDQRARQNTPESGIWTLGLENATAQHLYRATLSNKRPFHALLCSDGFSALVETYQRYTASELLDAALTKGLSALVEELRYIENELDPDATQYPRYKRSDDATALLCLISD